MSGKKINLLHIITNLELGGAQKYALYTIANLDDNKYKKYFISAPQGILYEDTATINNVEFYFLPDLKRDIAPLRDFWALVSLIKYIKEKKIDIVHTHSSKAGILGRWAAKVAGVAVIIHTIHGWSFHEHLNKLTQWLYIFLEKITARITNKLIAVSQSDINKGITAGIAKKDKYVLIRYGINQEEKGLDISKIKEKFAIYENNPVIAMIACLKPQKNPMDFIKTAEIISKARPDVRFISIGDGILRGAIERYIEEKKLKEKVRLLGWRKDVYSIMPMFDIVVLTSLWEGLPIVLLEAMVFSKPVIAYDVDGVREVIKDGENGYLIEKGNIRQLVRKVNVLLQDKTVSAKMGQKGRYFWEKSVFKSDYMISQLDNLYVQLIMDNRKH